MVEQVTKLHKYQTEAWLASERFVAIVSGKQGGKTTYGSVWSRHMYDDFPDEDGMIGVPTYKFFEQSTLRKFFDLNPDLKRFYLAQRGVIKDPARKGTIFLRSLDDPNSIEGMTLRWIWLDEAGQMKYDAWLNSQARVSIKQGKILLTTTPYNMGWLYSDFYDRYKMGDENYNVIQFRSIDNPYFSAHEFERLKSTLDPRIFRRQYEGKFERMEGLVYDDWNYETHVIDQLPEHFDIVIAGVDWGFNAPTAIAVIGVKNGLCYLIHEFYRSNLIQTEIEEQALFLQKKYNIERWYPDSAEPDRIESFSRRGLYCLDVNKDIDWGINQVRELIKQQKFKVHVSCVRFIDEIESYCYPEPKDGKPESENPIKGNDHCLDACRYALSNFQTLIPQRRREPIVMKRQIISSSTGY